MTTIQSKITDCFKDDLFCIGFARTIYPGDFDTDEHFTNSAMQSKWLMTKCGETVERDRVEKTHFDMSFSVIHRFSKSLVSRGQGWEEVNFAPESKTFITGPMNIIVRDRIQCTKDKFIKALWHYRANCLFVNEIVVDNLSVEQIKKAAKDEKYNLVLMEEVMGRKVI